MARRLGKRKIAIIGASRIGQTEGEAAQIPGQSGVELHSLWGKAEEIDFAKFRRRWKDMQEEVSMLMADLAKRTFGNMELEEVEVNIGVSGEGTIGIASAKGEASIVMKFTREGKASR